MVVGWSGTCHKFNRQDGVCQYGSKCRFDHFCARFGGPHSELDSPAVEWDTTIGAGPTGHGSSSRGARVVVTPLLWTQWEMLLATTLWAVYIVRESGTVSGLGSQPSPRV